MRFPLSSLPPVLALVVLGSPLAAGRMQRPTPAPGTAATAAKIVSSAQAFISTLAEAQRATLIFPFDSPQKTRWSNLPTGIYQRTGIRFGDLTPAQRAAAMTLLAAALSKDGYQKATDIMRGDEVLRASGATGPGQARGGRGGQAAPAAPAAPGASSAPAAGGAAPPAGRSGPGGGGGRGLVFGDAEYYIAFLGAPSVTSPWMLQFGGHHLAINLTMMGAGSSMTPSLPAAEPATYTVDSQTIRPLGDENDKGFALINALNAEQRGKAILSYQVSDLVLGPGADGRVIQPEGIPGSALSAAEQRLLLGLIEEWAGIVNESAAAARMAEIEANLSQTYFAWSGPTTDGSVAYFRIQGPTLVIEYAPQRTVTHVHTIYRDPTNDYGAKLLR